MQEAWDLFRSNREQTERTIEFYQDKICKQLKDWLSKPLIDIGNNRRMVREKHEYISKNSGKYAANGTLRVFRAIYNKAMKEHPELPLNPVIAVEFHKEKRRDWVIPKEEFPLL